MLIRRLIVPPLRSCWKPNRTLRGSCKVDGGHSICGFRRRLDGDWYRRRARQHCGFSAISFVDYGLAGEWRAYRRLKTVDRLRATFADDTASIETLRAAALGWLDQQPARCRRRTIPSVEVRADGDRDPDRPAQSKPGDVLSRSKSWVLATLAGGSFSSGLLGSFRGAGTALLTEPRQDGVWGVPICR